MFALLHLPLFFDPCLNFFFFFNDKTCCFQLPKLDDCVNLFSLMCKIVLTIPQSLHVVYDITVDRAPGRFSSHHCRNRWSILCLNSKKTNKQTKKAPKQPYAHLPSFSNLCGEQTNNFIFVLALSTDCS